MSSSCDRSQAVKRLEVKNAGDFGLSNVGKRLPCGNFSNLLQFFSLNCPVELVFNVSDSIAKEESLKGTNKHTNKGREVISDKF
jgi:hypothetical protein